MRGLIHGKKPRVSLFGAVTCRACGVRVGTVARGPVGQDHFHRPLWLAWGLNGNEDEAEHVERTRWEAADDLMRDHECDRETA